MDREIPAKERLSKRLRVIPFVFLLLILLVLATHWLNSYLKVAIVRESDILTATGQDGRFFQC
jgi:hypothetical protein